MGLFDRWFRTPEIEQALKSSYEPGGAKGVEFSRDFVWTVQQGMWPSLSAYGDMYRKQPAVRAAVDWLGRNIAQLNPKVYERVGDSDRVEIGEHPLAVALRRPNPSTTRYRHLRDTVQDMAIYDHAVWSKERINGRLIIVRLPPKHISVEVIDGETRWVDARSGRRYRRNQLVIFPGYSPEDDNDGVSPLETLRRVLAEEFASQQNREGMWRNAARQSGWIERPVEAPDWSDDARRRFRADVEAVMTGANNAGRVGILEEGMTWNGTSFSPKDTEYIEGRKLTYEEVCIAYGLQPGLLGLGGDTASSAEARHRQTYQDVLGPWLRMLQDEIELQLLPEVEPFNARSTVYVEFNLKEKLKGSFEEEQKAIATGVGVPHMTVNEGRARQNLPKIDEPWADLPVQPLNVMYGGQPATTVPTGDPSTASVPAPKMKAASPADESTRDEEAELYRDYLRAYFSRVEAAVLAAKGKAPSKPRSKWDDELRADLFERITNTVRSIGLITAGQLRGRYNHARVIAWLTDNADRTAKSVNDHIFAAVDEAEDREQVRHVFEVAKTAQAEQLGFSLATVLVNFARTEAARHSRDADGKERVKTWVVTSSRSRHPQMDGETVPVSENFSNGARWPGDPSLGADEAAGCNCQLELGEAPE